MPKKKKTRQLKILADKRRVMQMDSLIEQVKLPIAPVKKTVAITTSSYQYLAPDLRKTAVFTGIIVVIELLLKFTIR